MCCGQNGFAWISKWDLRSEIESSPHPLTAGTFSSSHCMFGDTSGDWRASRWVDKVVQFPLEFFKSFWIFYFHSGLENKTKNSQHFPSSRAQIRLKICNLDPCSNEKYINGFFCSFYRSNLYIHSSYLWMSSLTSQQGRVGKGQKQSGGCLNYVSCLINYNPLASICYYLNR